MTANKCPPGTFIVRTDDPDSIARFVSELRESITELTQLLVEWMNPFLSDYFEKRWKGSPERSPDRIFKELFNIWCRAANLPNPLEVIGDLVALIELENLDNSRRRVNRRINDISTSLNLTKNHVVRVIDKIFVEIRSRPEEKDKIISKRVWVDLYSPHMQIYAKQTAHVTLARILLYRVMEDKKLSGYSLELSRERLQTLLKLRREGMVRTPILEAVDTLFSRLANEGFVPQVYGKAEYDWWSISYDEVSLMDEESRRKVSAFRDAFDTAMSNVLIKFDSYCLAYVDRDVWKEVYQDYLEEGERQKLGGFVTPDELVSLIVDLTGYEENQKDLCQKSVLDPACGSGTFLVEAVSKLRKHLDRKMKCHYEKELAHWEKAAYKLNVILHNIVGIDIHPFATFLTTVNIFFQIVDLYAVVRQNNPEYRINVRIYTRDSLKKETKPTTQRPLDVWINGRLREGRKRLDLSRAVLEERFDFVFGNPPWGNVLKKMGPLADIDYRDYLEESYRPTASGKYDICVLFLHRGLEWLKNTGTLGMVVNNWFLVRSFGKGIRNVTMRDSVPRAIIDFGDHGPLFFRIYTADGKSKGAMNNPIVLILERMTEDSGVCVVRVSKKAVEHEAFAVRRSKTIQYAREALEGNLKKGVKAFSMPLSYLRENIENGWLLAHPDLLKLRNKLANINGVSLSSLFNDNQGVTTGLNSAYIITGKKVREKRILEENLAHKFVRGRDIKAWKIILSEDYIIYPYVRRDNEWSLAFRYRNADILDLSEPIDDQEITMDVKGRLNHRIAKGLVDHQNTASHLVSHYDNLKQRKFEGKFVEEYAGAWYAYHRPRDPAIMTCIPKILTPRLTDKACFALDEEGILPLDSVITLAPNDEFDRYVKELSEKLDNEYDKTDLLKVFLAFMISPIGDFLICVGRPRTPKGDYSIDEKLLFDFKLPSMELLSQNLEQVKLLLTATTDCIQGKCNPKQVATIILKLYRTMFGIAESDLKLISEWREGLDCP